MTPNLVSIPLSHANTKQKFVVRKIRASGEIRRRLIDIGFINGEFGTVVREALLRDPIELEIKGAHVSLRRSEAKLIDIELIE